MYVHLAVADRCCPPVANTTTLEYLHVEDDYVAVMRTELRYHQGLLPDLFAEIN